MEPVVGQIYSLRASVQVALRTAKSFTRSNPSSSHSSFAASASCSSEAATTDSNGSGNEGRPPPRRCLLWNNNASKFTVLVFTRFNARDLADVTDLDDMLFPKLSQEEIFELVVPIHPTPSLPGREAIVLEKFSSSGGRFLVSSNNYVILQAIPVKRKAVWPEPYQERISTNDMLYLNRLIGELAQKRLQLNLQKQECLILNTETICIVAKSDDDVNEDALPTSPLPTPRGGALVNDCVAWTPSTINLRISAEDTSMQRILNWLSNCSVNEDECEESESKTKIMEDDSVVQHPHETNVCTADYQGEDAQLEYGNMST